ncbi:g1932 [Coccomyxa elongata]
MYFLKTFVAPLRGATFTLPIDYTQLLGLRGRDSYLDPQILAAYEALAAAPIEEGFSARAADGRTCLLQSAVDELRRSKGRGTIQEKGIDVEWALLPGALALLQEVGEHDIVLEYGSKALEKWEARSMRRDILFAMAMAHLGLASDALEAKEKKVALGSAHLEEALCLLKDAGQPPVSPILEQEIQEALVDFKPDCTLEHLKLPLDGEHANTRKAAIAVLQAMLAQPDLATRRDGSSAVTPDYVRTALARLTGHETVQLLDWADIAPTVPELSWAYPGLLEKVALAHITVGFTQRRPSLVRVAEKLLDFVPDTGALVERVVAKALLDAPEDAVQLLLEAERHGDLRYGKQPDASSSAGDGTSGAAQNGAAPFLGNIQKPDGKEALAFIRAHSPDGDEDLLPGLCQFTERWLIQVAFSQFRDTAAKVPSSSLHAYYEDKRVTSFLALRGDESKGMLGAVASISDGVASSLGRLLPSPRSPQKASPRKDTSASAPARQATPKETRLPDLASATIQRRQRGWWPAWLPAPGSGAATFVGFAVLLGAVAAATRARPLPKPLSVLPEAALTTGAVVQRMKFPWQQISNQELTVKKAEQVVRRWQAAKAQALGPWHNTAALHTMVAEPWLSSVMEDAAKAKEAGWFWQFKINSVKVLSVDTSNLTENGGHAVVSAWIDEKGDLYANSGKRSELHSYSNPYTVEYTLTRAPDGAWRISNALVTGGR